MKLKVHKYITEEIELKEPLYLYFQDDDSIGEKFFKIWGSKVLIVKTSMTGVNTIELKAYCSFRECEIDENNRTTKEHFDESLEWVLKQINNFNGE